MAVTTTLPDQKSDQYELFSGANRAPGNLFEGRLHRAIFTYTHTAGLGGTVIDIVALPAGKIRMWHADSWIYASQMETGAKLGIGFRAYTDPENGGVAADHNAFRNQFDIGGGALADTMVVNAETSLTYKDFNSTSGVRIVVAITDNDIANGDTVAGYVTYSRMP